MPYFQPMNTNKHNSCQNIQSLDVERSSAIQDSHLNTHNSVNTQTNSVSGSTHPQRHSRMPYFRPMNTNEHNSCQNFQSLDVERSPTTQDNHLSSLRNSGNNAESAPNLSGIEVSSAELLRFQTEQSNDTASDVDTCNFPQEDTESHTPVKGARRNDSTVTEIFHSLIDHRKGDVADEGKMMAPQNLPDTSIRMTEGLSRDGIKTICIDLDESLEEEPFHSVISEETRADSQPPVQNSDSQPFLGAGRASEKRWKRKSL